MPGSNWKRPSAPADEVTRRVEVRLGVGDGGQQRPRHAAATGCRCLLEQGQEGRRDSRAGHGRRIVAGHGGSSAGHGAGHHETETNDDRHDLPDRAHPDTVSTRSCFTSRTRHR